VRSGKKHDGSRGASNANKNNDQNGRNHEPLALEDVEPEALSFLIPVREVLRFLQRLKWQESHNPVLRGLLSVWGRHDMTSCP